MRIPKTLRLGLALALAGCAMPLSAQTAAPIEGIYQSRMMEVGSQLALAPDGRFLWFFSAGALDMNAEGRWTRESDGTILLNSDPPVTPPRFELVGRSRDSLPGVAIRLACDSGQAYQFLDPIVEYEGGERVAGQFEALQFRSPTDAPRPAAAVFVGSGAFDLLSERVPVSPGGDNVFTFRFIRNDLGRADFRNVRATVANGALTFTWRESPFRYTRESTAVGQQLPHLPPPPGSGVDAAPAALEVAIGEPFAGLVARAGDTLTRLDGEGIAVARGPIDLRLGYDGPVIDLGRVDGGRQPLMISTDGEGERVGGVSFSYAPGLLSLDEALSRAQALKQRLEQAGFGVLPGADRLGDLPNFTTRPADGGDGVHAADWADAARMLADDAQGISAMELFTIRSQSHMAFVRLENERRHEREMCPHSEWRSEGGREWRLLVQINPSLAPARE